MNVRSAQSPQLPYKSVAAALLFSAVLSPVGLLYASFWSGFGLIFIDLVAVKNNFLFVVLLLQIFSCILAVGGVEKYNKKLLDTAYGFNAQ